MKRNKSLREGRAMEPARDSESLRTIIASTPGIAEQSLRATLESLPSLHIAGTAAGCLSALQMVRDSQADLVVIDANLPLQDVQVLLQQLEEERLKTRSLVLAATSSQVRRALTVGADAALRRDASIRQLGATVDKFRRAAPVQTEEPGSDISATG